MSPRDEFVGHTRVDFCSDHSSAAAAITAKPGVWKLRIGNPGLVCFGFRAHPGTSSLTRYTGFPFGFSKNEIRPLHRRTSAI